MKPTCSICLEPIRIKDNAKLHCKHNLHLKCVLELRSTKCPICRRRLSSVKLCEEDLQKMASRHQEDQENFYVDIEEINLFYVEEMDFSDVEEDSLIPII